MRWDGCDLRITTSDGRFVTRLGASTGGYTVEGYTKVKCFIEPRLVNHTKPQAVLFLGITTATSIWSW